MENNTEKLTALPEILSVVDLPQLSFEELDKIEYSTLEEKTDDELKQIAQSAANAADVLINTETSKVHTLTHPEIRAHAKAMANLLHVGPYDFNAQFAGSIVIAANELAKLADPKNPLEISYDNYQHLIKSGSLVFKGNAKTAAVVNNIFVSFNSVALDIAKNSERLNKYELLYKAGSDIVMERELLAKAEAEGIEVQEAESTSSTVDLTAEK